MTLRNFSSTAAQTTLSAGVTAASTTLTVAATTGFPPPPFILAVNAGASAQELVLVTAVAGTNLTVTRGYDSTVASAHDAGAVIQHSHAALDFREANTHVNATSGVHGLAGGAVGTTDAQALTNKDLTSGTNSFPASLATTAGVQTLTNKTLALGSNTVSGTKAQFDTALTDGDFATLAGAETLTNKTLTSPAINSPTWGSVALAAYTPTLYNLAIGNGTISARWYRIDKLIFVRVYITGGTTTSASGQVGISLPVNAHGTGDQSLFMRHYSTGTTQVTGWGHVAVGTPDRAVLYVDGGATLSTFGNGYNLSMSGFYEAA